METYHVHMSSSCIYHAHELIKFIKNSYIFFSSYSICVYNFNVKFLIMKEQ
jgi:hypothetical protein